MRYLSVCVCLCAFGRSCRSCAVISDMLAFMELLSFRTELFFNSTDFVHLEGILFASHRDLCDCFR